MIYEIVLVGGPLDGQTMTCFRPFFELTLSLPDQPLVKVVYADDRDEELAWVLIPDVEGGHDHYQRELTFQGYSDFAGSP